MLIQREAEIKASLAYGEDEIRPVILITKQRGRKPTANKPAARRSRTIYLSIRLLPDMPARLSYFIGKAYNDMKLQSALELPIARVPYNQLTYQQPEESSFFYGGKNLEKL